MIQKNSATLHTPPTASRKSTDSFHADEFDQATILRGVFMNMAIEMSWQLALVVVVPIVGGYMLDTRYHHATPWLAFIGFGIAAIGTYGILRRVLLEANKRSDDVTRSHGAGR